MVSRIDFRCSPRFLFAMLWILYFLIVIFWQQILRRSRKPSGKRRAPLWPRPRWAVEQAGRRRGRGGQASPAGPCRSRPTTSVRVRGVVGGITGCHCVTFLTNTTPFPQAGIQVLEACSGVCFNLVITLDSRQTQMHPGQVLDEGDAHHTARQPSVSSVRDVCARVPCCVWCVWLCGVLCVLCLLCLLCVPCLCALSCVCALFLFHPCPLSPCFAPEIPPPPTNSQRRWRRCFCGRRGRFRAGWSGTCSGPTTRRLTRAVRKSLLARPGPVNTTNVWQSA